MLLSKSKKFMALFCNDCMQKVCISPCHFLIVLQDVHNVLLLFVATFQHPDQPIYPLPIGFGNCFFYCELFEYKYKNNDNCGDTYL